MDKDFKTYVFVLCACVRVRMFVCVCVCVRVAVYCWVCLRVVSRHMGHVVKLLFSPGAVASDLDKDFKTYELVYRFTCLVFWVEGCLCVCVRVCVHVCVRVCVCAMVQLLFSPGAVALDVDKDFKAYELVYMLSRRFFRGEGGGGGGGFFFFFFFFWNNFSPWGWVWVKVY